MLHPINHVVQWVISHHGTHLPIRWVRWASNMDWRVENRDRHR